MVDTRQTAPAAHDHHLRHEGSLDARINNQTQDIRKKNKGASPFVTRYSSLRRRGTVSPKHNISNLKKYVNAKHQLRAELQDLFDDNN